MKQETRDRLARVLIYLFPALVDSVVAQVGFVNAIRLAKMGASASVVAGIAAVWSLVYMVSCLLVSRMVTPANAVRMMTGACVSILIICGLFTVVEGTASIYVLCSCIGAATAFFFAPFQVFMKAVDTAGSKPITYSAGLYTFSWSMGFAIGPFLAGFLMETGSETPGGMETSGWKWVYLVSGIAVLLTAFGIRMLAHLAHSLKPDRNERHKDGQQTEPSTCDYSRMPDLVRLAWIGSGVGVMVFTLIRAVFPKKAVSILHLADSTQGTILFLMCMAQALTALSLCRSRLWMYRPSAVGVFGLIGLCAALLFGFSSTTLTLYCAATLFGIYSGAFFFYLVFHALSHPVKSSSYVAINEAVVGFAGIVGPVAGGLLADHLGFNIACAAGAAVILAVTIFQITVHRRDRKHYSGC